MITVSKDNTGDYTSIQEAVDAISSSTVSETIFIKNGTYNERVEITHNNITLIGESMDNVIITKDYYALMTMPDNTNVVPSGLILSLYTPITSTPIILPS